MSDTTRLPVNVPPVTTAPGAGASTARGRDGAERVPLTISTLLDSVSDGFLALDREWRFVYANAAAERFMRRPWAEVSGKTLWECFPEAFDRRFGLEYRRAVDEQLAVEFEAFYPEPLNAWFEVRAYPSAEGLSIFFRDTTRRRATDEALHLSEERYRALFDHMSEGFALHEIVCRDGVPCDYRFLDVNPAFEALTGLERGDVLGRLMSEVLPGEGPEWVARYGAVALSGETIRFAHHSTVLDRFYQVFAYRPAPMQFAVLFHDVTDHRRLEEELRVNLTKYSVLFDTLPLGISVTDAAGRVREINGRASQVLRVPSDAVLGQRIGSPEWRIIRPDGSLMPPEEFASVRAEREQAVIDGVETGIERPGEPVIWLNVSAAPIPLEGYGVVITYRDISRRKAAEARLAEVHRQTQEAQAQLEAAMEAVPAGLAILDGQGGIVRVNAAFERIWGSGRPPTRGVDDYRQYRARWLDTKQPVLPEEWASAVAARRGEPVVGQLLEIERFDGGRVVVLNAAAPMFDESRSVTGCVVAIEDVSRIIEAERALEKSEAALTSANARLEESNAALRRINETLEARVAERTADLASYASKIEALALDRTRAEERERQRIAKVVHDHLQQILSLARINLGIAIKRAEGRSTRRSLRDVDALIGESLDIARSISSDLSPAIVHRSTLGVSVRWLGRWFENRFGLRVQVEADETLDVAEDIRVTLFRAAREVLFNVVKHARAARAVVQVDRAPDGRILVTVSDDGCGFEPARLRAWDGAQGSFGLFSLREHLELIGGRVEIDSAPGRGTTATLVGPLPGTRDADHQTGSAEPDAVQARSSGGKRVAARPARAGQRRPAARKTR